MIDSRPTNRVESTSALVDRFARDNLPAPEDWPSFQFTLPELNYPARVNAGKVLLDDAVREGHGERVALRSDEGNWTYAQLLRASNQIAHVLSRDLGLVSGNRILLRGRNCPMLAAIWLTCIRAGIIPVTTMPMLRSKELAQIIGKARIGAALCDDSLADELQVLVGKSELLTLDTWGTGSFESKMAAQPPTFEPLDTAADDVALFAFTSGTTGLPKATVQFHRDILAVADVVGRHLLETAPEDIYVGSPPLGFTFGLGALLIFPLRFRASAVLVEQPTIESLLASIARHRVTCLFTAPTMYKNMLPLLGGFDLTSLRSAVSAGESLSREVSEAWHRASGLRLIDGIGSTEMMHIFISAKGDSIRPGATGRPLPGYEAVVLDEQGEPQPRGHSGILAVRGPTGCRYLADDRQREYVKKGWNVTGDRYFVDEDGYFWFEGRLDDMIVSSGYNISGPEVEAALASHAAVKECAVVGAPDPHRGQVVRAFVVIAEGITPSAALVRELQDFVKAQIAPYKYPRVIEFVALLPKTPTGKIQRAALRALPPAVALP